MSQLAYWDGPGAAKTFTHPLRLEHLADVPRDARVLDYGCGYGRLMGELAAAGFTDVSGVDLSPALVERGRREHPGLRFGVIAEPPAVPAPAASFGAVLLFAVLTCVPEDDGQRALVAEIERLLAPGGLLYVSDLLLQDDERNLARYAAAEGPYGVFTTDDGARCRHHAIEHLRGLLGGFEIVAEERIEVGTMNGHRSRGAQLVARRR